MLSKSVRRFSVAMLLPVLCILMLVGCSGSSTHTMTSITVTPATAAIAPGATQQYKATASFGDGTTSDVTNSVTWSSSTPAAATINSAGLATAVATGSTTITATSGTVSGSATLNVATLTSIAITPASVTIAPAATQQFAATGTFSNSATLDITGQVTWASATTTVATINSAGLATAVAVGTSNISATLGAITSTTPALLTVSTSAATLETITLAPLAPTIAVGTTVAFVATGHFSDGSTQTLSSATWSSAATTIASVLSPDGIAIGQATGSSVISATVGAISGNTTVSVVPAVARGAYAAGTSDGNISEFAFEAASSSLVPIGAGHGNNITTQIVPEPSGHFAFALTASEIVTLNVDAASARLTSIASTVSTSFAGNQAIVDPSGRYLYVAGSTGVSGSIFAYKIASDGSLTINGPATAAGSSPFGLIADRSGQFVYVTDQNGNKVFAFGIQTGGALAPLATASYPTGNFPQIPSVDGNKHLFIPNSGDASVSVFTIAADGSLAAVTSSPFTAGIGGSPEMAAPDTSGKFLFVTNALDNTISAVPIAADGSLGAAVSGSPFAAGITPVGIAVDPSNTTLAVANLFGNTISVFSLNAGTGFLTPASPLPQVETCANPFFVTFGIGVTALSVVPGPVFAPNAGSNDISAFSSTAGTGVLAPAATPTVAGTTGNNLAATDLGGKFLFTSSAANNLNLAGFSIDPSTGGLTALPGSPITASGTDSLSAVLVAPQTNFAYAFDSTNRTIVQFPISLPSGSVSSPGTPVNTFAGASSLAADPQGDFIYAVGNNGTNAIQVFTTYLSGGLLAAGTQTTPIPGNFTSAAVDGSGQFLVAVDSTAKTVSSFAVTPAGTDGTLNGADGTLAAAGSSLGLSGAGPWLVSVDPKDRAIFVADQGAGTITPYPFNPTTGAISVAGTPVTASANGITQLTTDAAGGFVYAGLKAAPPTTTTGAVAVFKIGAAGALSAVAGSPFTAGTGNSGVAATNTVQ